MVDYIELAVKAYAGFAEQVGNTGVQFEVNCDELENIATQIGKSADEFKMAYESIHNQLVNLKEMWVGVDSEEFAKVIPDMDGDIKKVYDQFISTKDKLTEASSTYKWVRDENRSRFYGAF